MCDIKEFDKLWIRVWRANWAKLIANPPHGITELRTTSYYKSSGTTWYEQGEDERGEYVKHWTDGNQKRKHELIAIWRRRYSNA